MGRMSQYDPKYCEMIVAHGREACTISTFAADIGVNRATLYDWRDAHPEFAEAMELAVGLAALAYERALYACATKGGGNATAAIFGLKNRLRDDWKDVSLIEQSGPNGAPIHTVTALDMSALTDEQLRAVASIRVPTAD